MKRFEENKSAVKAHSITCSSTTWSVCYNIHTYTQRQPNLPAFKTRPIQILINLLQRKKKEREKSKKQSWTLLGLLSPAIQSSEGRRELSCACLSSPLRWIVSERCWRDSDGAQQIIIGEVRTGASVHHFVRSGYSASACVIRRIPADPNHAMTCFEYISLTIREFFRYMLKMADVKKRGLHKVVVFLSLSLSLSQRSSVYSR